MDTSTEKTGKKAGNGDAAGNSAAAAAEEADLPPAAEAPAEAAAPGEGDAAPAAPADPLQARIDELSAEVSDLKDKLLRAVADTENLRRRTEREKADLRKFAVAEFARDMLAVTDNLQRALAAVPEEARAANAELAQLLEGVELTERELRNQFEKHGIKAIDPLGEKLDPNLHQAMVQIEDPEAEPGTVVQVMQVGYVLKERLLRAAMVGVATGGAKAEAPANDDDAATGEPDADADAGGPAAPGDNVDTKA